MNYVTCGLQWGPSRHLIQCLSSVTSALAKADQASGRGAVLEGEDAGGGGEGFEGCELGAAADPGHTLGLCGLIPDLP